MFEYARVQIQHPMQHPSVFQSPFSLVSALFPAHGNIYLEIVSWRGNQNIGGDKVIALKKHQSSAGSFPGLGRLRKGGSRDRLG